MTASISSWPNPSAPVDRDRDAERLLFRLQRREDAVGGPDEAAELAVGVRVAVRGRWAAVRLAGPEDHARDRAGVDRDLQPGSDLLGEIESRHGRFEPVGVPVVQVEPDPLGVGEGRDRLGRARQDLLRRPSCGRPTARTGAAGGASPPAGRRGVPSCRSRRRAGRARPTGPRRRPGRCGRARSPRRRGRAARREPRSRRDTMPMTTRAAGRRSTKSSRTSRRSVESEAGEECPAASPRMVSSASRDRPS